MLCVRRGIVRVKRGSRSSSHQSLLRRTFECDRTDLLRNVFDRSIDVELRLRITGSRSRSAYRSKVPSEAGTPGACAVRVVEWVYLGLIVISSTPSGTTLSPKPTFALAPAMAEHGQAALDGRSRFCRANRMQARDARRNAAGHRSRSALVRATPRLASIANYKLNSSHVEQRGFLPFHVASMLHGAADRLWKSLLTRNLQHDATWNP